MRILCLTLSLLMLLSVAEPTLNASGETEGAAAESVEPEASAGTELPLENEEPLASEEEAGTDTPDLLRPTPEEIPVPTLYVGSTVVYDFGQLKAALSEDNQITEVYLGADIVMEGGIDINPNKASVVIDGVNPLPDTDKTPHTLTDASSLSQSAAIRVDAPGIRSVVLRNMTIVGKNYYGTVTVTDLYGSPEAVITYERVDYNGPQICYHRQGTVRFKDSTVRIHGGNGGSPAQEVAELKHAVFEGNNTVTVASSGYSCFWLVGGGSLELLDDASLILESQSTSVLYGILYCGGSLNSLRVTVGSRAVLDVRLTEMFAPVGGCLFESLNVREGGRFLLTSTKSPSAAVLTLQGEFKLETGADFIFNGTTSSSYVALRQEKGDIKVGTDASFQINAAAYSALINLIGTSLVCDNPASVLLKNNGRLIRAEISPGGLSLSARQLNYWSGLTETPQDNPPDYKWEKSPGDLFTLSATLATGTAANWSTVDSNYNTGEPPGIPPTVSNFSMASARVLAWGSLNAEITAARAGTSVVGGLTAPGALVRAYSRLPSGDEVFLAEGTADNWGVFQLHLSDPLFAGMTVVARCFWNYLSAEGEAVVVEEGRLELFAPETIEFTATPVSPEAVTIGRAERGWCLNVVDTRGEGARWRLYVNITGDLSPEDKSYPPLDGAVVFVNAQGKTEPVPILGQMEIFSHTTGEEELFTVSWPENQGPMLSLLPLEVCVNMSYSTQFIWTLVDGP